MINVRDELERRGVLPDHLNAMVKLVNTLLRVDEDPMPCIDVLVDAYFVGADDDSDAE